MEVFIRFTLLVLTLRNFAHCIDCDSTDHNVETRIKHDLFCNEYDSAVRPVKNHKTNTTVTVKMIVKSYDFNDHYSTLTINSWTVNRWKDEYLVWDPLEYNNIKSIEVSSSSIWRPDFALYNADISYGIGSCHETACLIEHGGAITCIEPCSYTAHCKTDFSLWPYDRQNCSMIFGPWMNNEDEIDYVSEVSELSLEAVAQHTQWKLISGSVSKKVFSISSKDKKFITKFPNLIYSFTIERHASLITKVIGSSCVLLISINILSIFIDTGLMERISMIAVNIVLHFQTIHQLSWMLPHSGDTEPRTLVFYRNSLIITCLLLLQSLLVKTISLSERAPPERMKSFILFIQSKQFGFMFLERTEDKENNDENILIEGKEIKNSANNQMWRNLCFFIDKVSLLLITILYVIFCLTLIPFNYIANSSPIKVATN